MIGTFISDAREASFCQWQCHSLAWSSLSTLVTAQYTSEWTPGQSTGGRWPSGTDTISRKAFLAVNLGAAWLRVRGPGVLSLGVLVFGVKQRGLDAQLLELLHQVPVLVHLQQDVTATHELTVEKDLWDGGPVGVVLDTLP